METSHSKLKEVALRELRNNNLAIFAGAGLSRSSGYVGWKNLLGNIASELGLDVNKESDLISLAQYHTNENGRQTINQTILEEFAHKAVKNDNMNILSRLPIDTYWTTNYDSIIEDTLEDCGKIVDKKIEQSQMKNHKPNRDVVVYKMHGDKEFPDHAVITRDDYEKYNNERSFFTTQLKGELISKTFLFIGFSFEDPNLEHVLSKIRVDLLENSPKNHYCFFRRVNENDYIKENGNVNEEEFYHDKAKQDLKIKDLKRYGINTVLIEEYSDITKILKEIEEKSKVNKIFISGSAEEYGNFSREKATYLMHNLSKYLMRNNYQIISGFGLGVGSFIINGSLEEIFRSKDKNINDFLTLRPFPQNESGDESLKKLWSEYRENMIDDAGVAIFLFGNKSNGEDIVTANGVIEEYQIAKNKGKFIIPIGSTGYAAREIYDEVKNEDQKYWYLEDSLETLKNNLDPDNIISEVKKIIDRIESYR